jgi:protein tyrosine phosphatase (PTP) superfamily phosphohydrolase (DUF442 family)
MLQVRDNVMLAGELDDEFVTRIAGTDALVIDLRGDDQVGDERVRLAELDVDYIHYATGGSTPSPEHVLGFAQLLTAAGSREVVVHCVSGNRAGMMWAAHRIASGATLEAAQDEVGPIVTKEPIREAIKGFAVESD